MLGVKVVIAESFERIHRSNLIGMGILPLQFVNKVNRTNLNLIDSELISVIKIENGVNPSDIYKPGFARNDKKIDNKLQWTSILNKPIMEPIREIIAKLPCQFERIRLMKLAAGKSLRKHNDNIDPDIENKKIVRIHVPIRTNSEVVFTMYENDDDDDGEKLNLKTGHFYYLDVTKPHSVSNNSTIDRYHLVVDCYVNEELKAIL